MNNVFETFAARLHTALEALEVPLADAPRFTVEPPRDTTHGDLASNAAMVLAKISGQPSRALAERLAEALRGDADIQSVEVAGPGFLNIRLKPAFWQAYVCKVLQAGSDFGRSNTGAGQKVNVEYVSANPTGPLHVAHCRGAVVGDAIAALLAFTGFSVTREYYINDAGGQVDTLARSAFLRYREALGETIGDIPEGLYPGAYLKAVGEALKAQYGASLLQKPESAWLPHVRAAAIDAMMCTIRDDLKTMGVAHEVFFSEKSLNEEGREDKISAAINALKQRGHIYTGVLPPPKGGNDEEAWEEREQLLFRSTAFGDDVDRALVKPDGSYTYFAADIAYHFDKATRGFSHMIDVWGADHSGYVKRMKSAVRAITGGEGTLEVVICQLVRLLKNGELFKMSKRAGSFVTVSDLVAEVGADAVRFTMLTRKNDAPLDFDLDRAIDMSRENPVFYVQYAHARGFSVFRQARDAFGEITEDALATAKTSLLVDEGELALIRRLAAFPRLIETAAQTREPHRVAFYLFELTSEFHAHWNRGKDTPHLRFINANQQQLSLARLALVRAFLVVVGNGLALLGVSAPEEMA